MIGGQIVSKVWQEHRLRSLLDRSTVMTPEGFSVDLSARAKQWDRCLKAVGVRRACGLMAERLCRRYKTEYGREYLFGERCVSREMAYHVNAYMWAKRFPGYYRNITTLLFTRKSLIKHCKEVDISTDDVNKLKQKLMFRYKKGVRKCYKGTPADPFRPRGGSQRRSPAVG